MIMFSIIVKLLKFYRQWNVEPTINNEILEWWNIVAYNYLSIYFFCFLQAIRHIQQVGR